jgi:hypothetical protein
MKPLIDYLIESIENNLYSFTIKIARELPDNCESNLKTMLEKYRVVKFKRVGSTPIQAIPRDFPNVKNAEVHMFDVELEYPVTTPTLTAYVAEQLGIEQARVCVLTERDEAELMLNAATDPTANSEPVDRMAIRPLLNRDYEQQKENQALAGDKYVGTFLKYLQASRRELSTQYTGVNDEILAKSIPKGE